ncbi:hypothetical protein [Sphingomonas sp. VNH70]|uniref:hypothetical protein n=1 Tax=Sphingomonas silueang TaxID=3156617 RepID=UPI0032B45936
MSAQKPAAWPARAIVLRELPAGGWAPVLHGSLVARNDPRRKPDTALDLVGAMSRARDWHARDGLPVLIQPCGSQPRVMDRRERCQWERTGQRPKQTLAAILDGTIHVMREHGGFTVCHESSGGNSWGEILGPFDQAAHAVAMAHQLNSARYGGGCEVAVCHSALAEIEGERQ